MISSLDPQNENPMNLDLEAEREKLLDLAKSVIPQDFLENIKVSSELCSDIKINESKFDIVKTDL